MNLIKERRIPLIWHKTLRGIRKRLKGRSKLLPLTKLFPEYKINARKYNNTFGKWLKLNWGGRCSGMLVDTRKLQWEILQFLKLKLRLTWIAALKRFFSNPSNNTWYGKLKDMPAMVLTRWISNSFILMVDLSWIFYTSWSQARNHHQWIWALATLKQEKAVRCSIQVMHLALNNRSLNIRIAYKSISTTRISDILKNQLENKEKASRSWQVQVLLTSTTSGTTVTVIHQIKT